MKVSIGSLLQKRALMHPQKEALVDVEQGKLAHYKIPKEVEFVDVLPRNPTGKIQKTVLRHQFAGATKN